ncbi:MAG TPA: WYL domain-containing protein [Candidatus Limnocylindrales bacterium]|nr:WYL domain-containing protein [Candidatus Limnocylindrales bacterium]
MDDAHDAREDRGSAKRDRLARMTRILALLNAHPAGMKPSEMARRVDSSVRTVYRDLRSIEGELGMPLWSEGGRWGVDADAFLPPLKLTRSEAMAVVLSARLMVRYADKYDPDLASAFEKLAGVLPAALREHVDRTLDDLSRRPTDETFSRHVRLLTQAWAERRVVSLDYAPAPYAPEAAPRTARVRPYLIEPSLQTHALYLIGWDETRDAMRTFKVERIRDVSLTPDTFAAAGAEVDGMFERAWDIIADQEPVEVELRFAARVASRVREARWHPTERVAEEADGSITWRATVAGPIEIRLWILSWGDDVEVVAPSSLRDDVAVTHARAAAGYAPGGRG